MNSKPRPAPPGGVSAVAHTLTANDAATLTPSVAEQMMASRASRTGVPAGVRWTASISAQRSGREPCLSVPPGCVNQWQALAAAAGGHRARTVAYVSPGPGCCLVLDETARVTGRPKAGRAATRSALEPGRAHPASSGGGDTGTGSDHMAASPFMG